LILIILGDKDKLLLLLNQSLIKLKLYRRLLAVLIKLSFI